MPQQKKSGLKCPQKLSKNFWGFFMRKKHYYEVLLKYMKVLEEGYSIDRIQRGLALAANVLNIYGYATCNMTHQSSSQALYSDMWRIKTTNIIDVRSGSRGLLLLCDGRRCRRKRGCQSRSRCRGHRCSRRSDDPYTWSRHTGMPRRGIPTR